MEERRDDMPVDVREGLGVGVEVLDRLPEAVPLLVGLGVGDPAVDGENDGRLDEQQQRWKVQRMSKKKTDTQLHSRRRDAKSETDVGNYPLSFRLSSTTSSPCWLDWGWRWNPP